LGGGIVSADVTGLPTDGRIIYVRLRYLVNGAWQSSDYQYTAASFVPELMSPVPGTVLSGSNVTFSWNSNGAAVTRWILYVGTALGSSNVHYSGYLSPDVVSANVSGIPTDSRTIYVRLRYLANGAWKTLDYQYTAANLVPELISPVPGTVLPGPDVTFSWTSNGAPATRWMLYVGTSPGSTNIHYSGSLESDVLSANVTGIPTDGRTIYVRLWYLNGTWKTIDYQYTAPSF
jgi:hypothetical protein